MCGLCGALGGAEHWTAGAGRLALTATRRAERLEQVRVSNAVLRIQRLHLDDWQGSAFMLSSATGKREIVSSMPEVWSTAQRMLGRSFDPLDPAMLAHLLEAVPR